VTPNLSIEAIPKKLRFLWSPHLGRYAARARNTAVDSMLTNRLLTCLFLMGLTCTALADDLCVDSGLASISPHKDCTTTDVKFQDEREVRPAKLASAFKEERRDIDVFYSVNHFALRLPDGEIRYLGEFKPWRTNQFWAIWSQSLGMTRVYSNTASDRNGDELFERIISKDGNNFCVLYRMKSPFYGELKDCDGQYPRVKDIGTRPEVVAPKDAWQEACKFYMSGNIEFCGENHVSHVSTIVRRASDGELNYVVELANYFDDSKIRRKDYPTYLLFVINPVKREVKFVAENNKNLGFRELVNTPY